MGDVIGSFYMRILRADVLGRVTGTWVTVAGDDTLVALQQNWPALRAGWADWARELNDDTAGADISYADLKGNPYTQPIWTIVLHVVNHSSHHRGQAVGFMRTLGHTPPNVDLITFSRQRLTVG